MAIIDRAINTLKDIFVGSKTIEKRSVINQALLTNNAIKIDIIPMLNDVNTRIGSLQLSNDEIKHILNLMYTAGFKGHGVKETIVDAIEVMTKNSEILDECIIVINEDAEDIITNRSVKPRVAYAAHMISTISTMSLFLPELMVSVIEVMTYKIGLPKAINNNVKENIIEFSLINLTMRKIDVRKEFDNVKTLKEIPFDMLNKNSYTTHTDLLELNLPTNGFVGNPIFHFRKWLIDRDADALENIKDKRAYIETKINGLILKKGGEQNTKIDKAIEYYRLKLIKYDKQTKKIMKG
jgi:hypothetical protein